MNIRIRPCGIATFAHGVATSKQFTLLFDVYAVALKRGMHVVEMV